MTTNALKRFFKGFILCSLFLLVLSCFSAFFISQNTIEANADNGYTWDDSTKTVTINTDQGLIDWMAYTSHTEHLNLSTKKIITSKSVSKINAQMLRGSDYPLTETIIFGGDIQIFFENFCQMNSLTTVEFNGGCHLVGNIFNGCYKLSNVTFNGVAKIGVDYPSDYSYCGSWAFRNCAITNLVFNDQVWLGHNCFNEINTLQSVTFKEESYLTQWPLSDCVNLRNINLEKATHIYDGNPFVCLWYGSEHAGGTPQWHGSSGGNSALESIYFPANSTIENCPGLFSYYYKLKYVEFESAVSLDEGAFTTCPSLEEIIFNDSSELGKGCFSYSYNLYPEETEHFPTRIKNINFGGPTKIDVGCFSSFDYVNNLGAPNSALRSLRFPEGSELRPTDEGSSSLGGYFSYFNALETVEFEGDIKLWHGCFQHLPFLKTVTFNKQCDLNGGAFSVCPNIEEINFCDIVKLGNGCFQPGTSRGAIFTEVLNIPDNEWNTKLKSLKFPKGSLLENESIYQSAKGSFCAYKNLETLEFEGDVTIPYGCFFNLVGLRSLKFDGKTEMRSGSFPNLVNIEEIYFGDQVQMREGCFSFYGWNSADGLNNQTLKSISFPEGSAFMSNGIPASGSFMCYLKLEDITFEGDIQIPNGCFQNCNALKNIQFMGSSYVDYGSFVPCENLETLEFGGPVEIQSGSFHRDPKVEGLDPQRQPTTFKNTKLKSLTIPEGSNFAVKDSYSNLFKCFTGLEEVTFQGDIEIRGSDFNFCESLKKVNFDKKSIIKQGAFAFCKNLEEINFGDSTEIHDGAFYVCDPEHLTDESKYINNALTSLTFPDGSIIGDTEENIDCLNFGGFFQNYKALESVTFEGKVVVGGGCFQFCDSLKTINFNGADSILTQGAFSYNPNLESVEFNNPIQILGGNFRFCKNLKNVVFNADCVVAGESFTNDQLYPTTSLESVIFNGTSSVGADSFKNCTSLKSLQCNGKTTIGGNAFSCDDEFTSLSPCVAEFSNGSEVMSNLCFKNYTGLKEVVFNDTAQTWVSNGFINCDNLNDIYYNAIDPVGFEALAFTNLSVETLKIHVPCISLERYKDELRKDTGENLLKALSETENHNTKYVDNVVPTHQPGTEYYHNQDSHWNLCVVCNEMLNKTIHNIPISWKTDANYHWHECEDCKYIVDKEDHDFENHICMICFYNEKIVPISEDVIPAAEEFIADPLLAVENLVATFDGKTWIVIALCGLVIIANFLLIRRTIKKKRNKK